MTARAVEAGASDPLAQAADWFSLHRAGEATRETEAMFAVWLAADAANLAAYRRVERSWVAAGAVGQDPAILATREADRRRFRWPRWCTHRLAAAAAVLAVTGSGWAMFGPVVPGATRPSGTYANAVGARTRLTLADGSVVTLDTDSEVRVRDMGRTRSLQLVRGRAFFAVAHDPARPFLVEAAGKTVRAIGTSFGVRIDAAAHDVSVTLVEGKVAVTEVPTLLGMPTPLAETRRVDLTPGARLDARDDGAWSVGRFTPADETAWLQGRLVFSRTPMTRAVAEMNRYSPRRLSFAGAAPQQEIVGVFRAGDVDALAQAIALSGAAEIVRDNGDELTLAAR